MSNILILYYSRTGKSRWVAQELGSLLAADVEEIREKKKRSGVLGFIGGIKDSLLKRPAELANEPSTQGRTVIVLGMPVWANNPPPAVRTYLSRHAGADLTGRKICAFCTFDGSGGNATLDTVARLVPQGLCERLALKKPRPGEADLAGKLEQWARRIKSLGE